MTAPVRTEAASTRRFWRVLMLIVLAAFGLRVAYVLVVTQFDNGFYDAAFYEFEARAVADGRGFVGPLPGRLAAKPAADHPPLTVIALAPAAKLPSDSKLWMRFTMALWGASGVLLIGLLGRQLAGQRAGLVAAGLGAVYANLWMNDGLLMSETLATLTTVGALILAYRLLRRETWLAAGALGVVCGLAALTRAELVLLVPLVALPAAWLAAAGSVASRLRSIGVVLAGAALVLAPWLGFNFARFDQPTFVSTGDGFALLGANCADTYHGPLLGLWSVYCVVRTTPAGDQSDINVEHRNRAIDYARDHAGRLPVVAAARLGRLFGIYNLGQIARYNAGEGRPEWATYLGIVSFLLLMPFAALGAVWLRRRETRIWPLLAPAWIVVFAAVAFYGLPRFRAPAEPVVVALAAIGVVALLSRNHPRWAPVDGIASRPKRVGAPPS